MALTLTGQTGKGLDATARSLDSLNFSSCALTLASLADDTLVWEAATLDATGAGTVEPTLGQRVELFDGATRRFCGHVLTTSVGMRSLRVKAVGPWWWMSQIMLSSPQADATGVTKDRPSYVFPTQPVSDSITDLIALAIADGVPIQLGSIAAMYSFPRITLSEMSYAQAFAELMSAVPDAVAWFGYTGTGYPTINVSRRASMSTYSFDLGNPGQGICDLSLTPRRELEVKRVDVVSTTRRSTDGFNQFATTGSGTATTGKNQIIVVSGEAVGNGFLPKDKYDSFQIKTVGRPTGGTRLGTLTASSPHSTASTTTAVAAWVIANDETLATMVREFGGSFAGSLILSAGGRFLTSNYVSGAATGAKAVNLDCANLLSKDDITGLYIVSSAERVPEWATLENGYTVKDATFTADVRWTLQSPTAPDWWDEGVARARYSVVGYKYGVSSTAGNYERTLVFPVSIPCQLISASFPTLTTVYRQWDYDYITPPSGMAANLLAAQNWLPWEGFIQQVTDTPTGVGRLHYKVDLAGALAGCTDMGALVKSMVYDFINGRITWNLGAPPRVDFGSLSNRFRRHPTDNIVYL